MFNHTPLDLIFFQKSNQQQIPYDFPPYNSIIELSLQGEIRTSPLKEEKK